MPKYSLFHLDKYKLPALFVVLIFAALIFLFVPKQSLFAQEASSKIGDAKATIVSVGLNVRSGPGLNFVVIGYVRQGDELEIVDQTENCRWLRVNTPAWGDGWISGKSSYATINVSCDVIGGAEKSISVSAPQQVQTAPTLAPTAPPALEVATPVANITPQNTTSVPATIADPPAGQGCYLLQNRLGPQLTVTFTNLQSGKSVQIIVPHGAELPHCMIAGKYTYTISAVGYKDENGEMKVIAGDAYMLPIGPQ